MSNEEYPRITVRHKPDDEYIKMFIELAKNFNSKSEAFREILKIYFDNMHDKDNEKDIIYKRLNKLTRGLDRNGDYLYILHETLIKHIKYCLTFNNNDGIHGKELKQKLKRGKIKYIDFNRSIKKTLKEKGII